MTFTCRRSRLVVLVAFTFLARVKTAAFIHPLQTTYECTQNLTRLGLAPNAVEDLTSPSPGALGPPAALHSMKIGESLRAFRATAEGGTRDFDVERLSRRPDAFLLRGYVTPSECGAIMEAARCSDDGMAPAETVTEGDSKSRTNCGVAWLPSADAQRYPEVSALAASTARLLLTPEVLSDPEAGVEDLQVLRYGPGGGYVLHHDGEPRVLTVIYYLNGIGGTWFPLAKTSEDKDILNINEKEGREAFENQRNNAANTPLNKRQALDLGKGFVPGRKGLLVAGDGDPRLANESGIDNTISGQSSVRIRAGDALAFYGYEQDGRLDWRALHSGLPVPEGEDKAFRGASSEKWIANHWYGGGSLVGK